MLWSCPQAPPPDILQEEDARACGPVTHLVEILAEEGSGLRGREVAELGHEVHLALGQQGGRGLQHPLAARDGLVLVLDGRVQGLDGLVQLEQRPLLLCGHGHAWTRAPTPCTAGHPLPQRLGPRHTHSHN